MALGGATTLKLISADEQTVAQGTVVNLFSLILLPGTLGLATVELRTGGSGGTILMKLEAALGVSAPIWTTGAANCGATFPDGLHVDVTGVGAECIIEYLVA